MNTQVNAVLGLPKKQKKLTNKEFTQTQSQLRKINKKQFTKDEFESQLAYLKANKAAGSQSATIALRCMDIASKKNLSQAPRGNALQLILKKVAELRIITNEPKEDIAYAEEILWEAFGSIQSGIDVGGWDEWKGNSMSNAKHIGPTWQPRYSLHQDHIGTEALLNGSECDDFELHKAKQSTTLKIDPLYQRYHMGSEDQYVERSIDDPEDDCHRDISRNTRCF